MPHDQLSSNSLSCKQGLIQPYCYVFSMWVKYVGCIESPKLPLSKEITGNVTKITNEMTEITSVYVRVYVS
jgi:hypothetical protein